MTLQCIYFQLHGAIGGELRPGYADTLKWYYRRAKSSQDKEHCLKLLTKLEVQKRAEKQQRLSKEKRPKTASLQVSAKPKSSEKQVEKPKIPTPPQEKLKTKEAEEKIKETKTTTYQQQLAVSQRLSRPKTVRYSVEQQKQSTETLQKRPKSAMADIGKPSTCTSCP